MKKIVVIGPESTGKSTLCRQLAEHYGTSWCPEYAREYLETIGREYVYDDLERIARGQLALEDRLQPREGLYFIDTNMYVMQVWSEFVFGKTHPFILEQAAQRSYDLYLLCNTDLTWTYDPLREYPDKAVREILYHHYREIMTGQSAPWVEISGDYAERFSRAVEAVEALR